MYLFGPLALIGSLFRALNAPNTFYTGSTTVRSREPRFDICDRITATKSYRSRLMEREMHHDNWPDSRLWPEFDRWSVNLMIILRSLTRWRRVDVGWRENTVNSSTYGKVYLLWPFSFGWLAIEGHWRRQYVQATGSTTVLTVNQNSINAIE